MEILVLLALASLALLAVGGLQYAATGYLGAQQRDSRLQQALLELHSMVLQISERPGLMDGASAAGFGVHAPDPAPAGEQIELATIRLDQGSKALVVQLLKNLTTIDLSAFSAISLEYLVDDGDVARWMSPPAAGGAIAARLVLWDGPVAWRPMIWSKSPLRSDASR